MGGGAEISDKQNINRLTKGWRVVKEVAEISDKRIKEKKIISILMVIIMINALFGKGTKK